MAKIRQKAARKKRQGQLSLVASNISNLRYFPPEDKIPLLAGFGRGDVSVVPVATLPTTGGVTTGVPFGPNCCNAPTIPATLTDTATVPVATAVLCRVLINGTPDGLADDDCDWLNAPIACTNPPTCDCKPVAVVNAPAWGGVSAAICVVDRL